MTYPILGYVFLFSEEYMYHYIYKTTNTINGKFYYGKHSTNNVDDGYLGSGKALKTAIKKYRRDVFVREVLAYCDSEEDAYELEELVVTQEEVDKDMCYNITLGGQGGEYTPPAKIQCPVCGGWYSPSNAKQWHFDNCGKKIKKKPLSDSTKKKIGDAHRGRKHSDEFKEKISKSKLGTKISDETKRKMSKAHKGIPKPPLSEEHKRKLRIAHKGKTLSESAKKKVSDALKGVPKKKIKCPHCGKEGQAPLMKRWHFDNCKLITGKSHKGARQRSVSVLDLECNVLRTYDTIKETLENEDINKDALYNRLKKPKYYKKEFRGFIYVYSDDVN